MASSLAALPALGVQIAFAVGLSMTLAAGLGCVARGRSPAAYAVLAPALGGLSLAAVVSWIAPSYYQLPTHHCPFCLLAPEHGYVGYPVYALLSLAVVAGGGSGLVHRLRAADPSAVLRAGAERRLCAASMAGFALFSLLALWPSLQGLHRLGSG